MNTPEQKLLDLAQPPTCLHILGQSLVNALWHEGQALKAEMQSKADKPQSEMSEQDRINLAFNGFKKGIVTYGEYLGVCAEMIIRYEQRQPLDTPWDYSDEYKTLCNISVNIFH